MTHIFKSMAKLFVVRHNQPKDIPFKKSTPVKLVSGPKYQNTKYLTACVIVICFSTLYYGLCLSMISGINAKILKQYFGDWAGQHTTVGLLIGFFPIGGAIGALTARLLIRFFTRKQILIIFDIFAIIVTGLLQIPNIGLLLALRILQGIIVGTFMAVVPLYVNQLVPLDLRGSEGVFSQILIVVGVVIDYIWKSAFTASNVNTQFHWRFVFAFTGLFCIIQLILLIFNFVPESPMSLILKGKMDEARKVLGMFNKQQVLNDVLAQMVRQSKQQQLKKIAKDHGVTPDMVRQKEKQFEKQKQAENQAVDESARPLERMNSSTSLAHQLPPMQTKRILSSIIQMYDKEKNLQPEVKRILSEHHIHFEPIPQVQHKVTRKALFLGFQLHFMQQFSGIKMVITEVSAVFEKYNPTLTLHSPLIANGAQLIATCVATFILSRFGRKRPTLAGNLALAIINFILAILFLVNYKTGSLNVIFAAFAFIILFMIGYALSIGPVVWPYVPELMPHKYVPTASCMNWIAAAICVIATPYILDAVGNPFPVFFFFGGILLIFFVINLKMLIETKGLTPTQIAAKLQK